VRACSTKVILVGGRPSLTDPYALGESVVLTPRDEVSLVLMSTLEGIRVAVGMTKCNLHSSD